jgi:hypothetical protein
LWTSLPILRRSIAPYERDAPLLNRETGGGVKLPPFFLLLEGDEHVSVREAVKVGRH